MFFFQKLYPFPWVNDPTRKTAAAAGGSMLVRSGALRRIGGIEVIGGELIDDCALAAKIKWLGGAIRLALATGTRSLRRTTRWGTSSRWSPAPPFISSDTRSCI